MLARAVRYLFTKETRSSFVIEGEAPSPDWTERFVAALRSASSFDTGDKDAMVRLQNAIVDRRYAATDWRDFQNFVGETTGTNNECDTQSGGQSAKLGFRFG
ncbi:hypothetical protein [Sphingobium sp. CFD-1]|uniref:hypothetical protein n=1 Tax=Sphingobium sp. CFD-1 TaxID=2878545 RepID=UPI00214CB938|nr:hypothetical protein [Sphingobium sp. CFD-1]